MSADKVAALFDELVVWAAPDRTAPDLLKARTEFFERTGEVFDDDRQLERRMAAFLDHFVCDRVSPGTGLTPARSYLSQLLAQGELERARLFRGFTETIHGLFEVQSVGAGRVEVEHLFSGLSWEVGSAHAVTGLETGDVVEARLIPFESEAYFSAAMTCHPKAAGPLVKAEAARWKKEMPERPSAELVLEAAKRSLKADRYRNIAIDRIYDFRESASRPPPKSTRSKPAG